MSATQRDDDIHRAAKMTRQEVLELFEWYDFRDPNEHKLTCCRDFLELLELAKPRIGD